MVRRVFHRSRDGTSLVDFLTEAVAASPHIVSDKINDQLAIHNGIRASSPSRIQTIMAKINIMVEL